MALSRRKFLINLGLSTWGVVSVPLMLPLLKKNSRTALLRPRAKAVVYLTLSGGPSQLETFDYKPVLAKKHGAKVDHIVSEMGQVGGVLMAPRFKFQQYGQSGAWVSEILPQTAKLVDDLAFIKSCTASSNNHGLALYEMNYGNTSGEGGCLGSWITYALGAQSADIPGHFVFIDHRGSPNNGELNWQKGPLPGHSAPILISSLDSPMPYLKNSSLSKRQLQQQLSYLMALEDVRLSNNETLERYESYQQRLDSFELSLQMQEKMGQVFDLAKESPATRALYGLDQEVTRPYGTQLLLTRKLLEAGARFVQVYHGGKDNMLNWDQHEDMIYHQQRAQESDRPIYGFIQDLKMRGLFSEVLLVCGGEFGKLPVTDEKTPPNAPVHMGREHNHKGFTLWLAGAGVRPGISLGETDEIGYEAVSDIVSHTDVQASVLHLLGLDYRQLSYTDHGQQHFFTTRRRQIIEGILS